MMAPRQSDSRDSTARSAYSERYLSVELPLRAVLGVTPHM